MEEHGTLPGSLGEPAWKNLRKFDDARRIMETDEGVDVEPRCSACARCDAPEIVEDDGTVRPAYRQQCRKFGTAGGEDGEDKGPLRSNLVKTCAACRRGNKPACEVKIGWPTRPEHEVSAEAADRAFNLQQTRLMAAEADIRALKGQLADLEAWRESQSQSQ